MTKIMIQFPKNDQFYPNEKNDQFYQNDQKMTKNHQN